MATDVFFRDGSTIKEALVAFLMRHVNFIKRGAEERRGERLQPRKAKCLFAFNSDKALPLSVCLAGFSSTYSLIGGSRPVRQRPTAGCGCVDVRAPLEWGVGGGTQKHRGGVKVLEDVKTRTV